MALTSRPRRDLGQTYNNMSTDELVDVVDESGNVLKIVPKKEAHTLGLLHKTVVSQVIDSSGRWLLTKQSSTRQDAGQYVCPVGGHVSAGESNEDALGREAEEELGLIEKFTYEYVGRAIFNREVIGRKENHFFIVYKIYSDVQPVINHESESYAYFTTDELRAELKNHPEKFGAAHHFVVKTFFPELLQ